MAQRSPSHEMQAVVQRLCGEFYALGSDALEAIRYALVVRKDGRIGYQILNDLGAIPSREERIAIAAKPSNIDKSTLTRFELAVAEDEHGQINRVAYGMACAMEESARMYGTPSPTAEEYRRLRRIAEVADELSGDVFTRSAIKAVPRRSAFASQRRRQWRVKRPDIVANAHRRASPSRFWIAR